LSYLAEETQEPAIDLQANALLVLQLVRSKVLLQVHKFYLDGELQSEQVLVPLADF
tara:strand:- start:3438 stop:3605 length:168 start_codon:yes stop_codon:yes gene_type:complete